MKGHRAISRAGGRGLMLAGVCDFERGVRCFVRVETVRQSDLWGGERWGGKLLDKDVTLNYNASQAITG